ncbi:putative reverse transcriptase domain-containing protein [Tanacetum coccineum]
MVGANHVAYTDRFHELAKLVSHLVTPESKCIDMYIYELVPQIRRMIRATQPTTIQSHALKNSEKRKEVVKSSKQGGSWTDNKRAEVGKRFVVAAPTMNEYVGSHPKCAKCYAYHPEGRPCRLCYNCQRPGHIARDCRSTVGKVAPVNAVGMGNIIESKENDNQARGRAFNVNAVEARQDPNVVTSNGKKVETDRIIHGCILELGDSLFTIDLISFGHGSFDVIVGMDWLSKHKAEIVFHEKVVRIPLASGKVLRVQGERTKESSKSMKSTKSDEHKLDDIPIVRDFPEVFPEDLAGLPP